MDRNKTIVKTSLIGIGVNAVMVVIKMIIGLASGSVSIILDAVNNFSDALTSIITIIGTRLSVKAPDKKHPYGYGRIEYITTIIISLVILTAGAGAIKESIEAILNKVKATYELSSLLILAVAIVAKFWIAKYTVKQGKLLGSHALVASGEESFFDGVLSISTLIAAGISVFFGLSLEGFIGIAIGVLIVKTGGEMLGETLSIIIGVRTDKNVSKQLKDMVSKFDGVIGVYDVILHNYGPNQHMGTIHIEVDELMNAKQIHILSQNIIEEVYDKMNIIITVGIYSSVHSDPVALDMRKKVSEVLKGYPEILQFHGFYMCGNQIGFDVVIDFKINAPKIIKAVKQELLDKYPNYKYRVILDLSYSD